MRSDLSQLEKKLLESQDLLETRGKFGRGVPVIIPPDLKDVLKYLATSSVRSQAARLSANKYLFANTSNGVIRAYDSLKTVCAEVELLKPEKITSVNLRKYTATISQVFDLNDQQQSWLVNHLGHSMDIHKIHYRQTSGAIERIEISKLMLLQEFNLASKYAGKQLKDIQLKELLFPDDVPEVEPEEMLPQVEDDDDDYTPHQDNGAGTVYDEFDFTEDDEIRPKSRKKSAQTRKREQWNQVETEELKTLFKENLETLTTPGMKECLKAIKLSKTNNGQLCLRPWETIKKRSGMRSKN